MEDGQEKKQVRGFNVVENNLKAIEYATQLLGEERPQKKAIENALNNVRRDLAITLGTFNAELDKLIGLASKLANCTDDDHEVVEAYAVVMIDFIEQLRDEVAGEKIEE